MLIRGKKTSSLRHFSYPPGKLDGRSAFSRRSETVLSRGTEERRREGEKVSKLVAIIERSRSSVVRKFVGRDLRFLPRNRIFDSRMK